MDLSPDRYNIYVGKERTHENVSEDEMMDIMMDFAEDHHTDSVKNDGPINIEVIRKNGEREFLTGGADPVDVSEAR